MTSAQSIPQYRTQPGRRWAVANLHPEHCPVCNDELRIISRGTDGKTFVSTCECVNVRRRIRLYNQAHLPAAYHDKRIESFDAKSRNQHAALHEIKKFRDKGAPGDSGLLLVGAPGVGKTHLVTALLRFLVLERGVECRYVDSFQLLEELKATFDAGSGSSVLMEEVSSVDVLGLDELGKTKPTGWQHQVLDQIISRRYDQGLTTFVISNYALERPRRQGRGANPDPLNLRETLEERVGSRIFSRLMEMCRPVIIDGDDRRIPSVWRS